MLHATASWVLKFVDFIVNLIVETYSTNPVPTYSVSIPHDIHTAISALTLEPEIIQYICCLKYFYHYAFENLPEKCTWQETCQSKICGKNLWIICFTYSGPKVVLQQLYTTQSLKS